MAEFFKNKSMLVVIGVICFAMLNVALLTSCTTKDQKKPIEEPNATNLNEVLLNNSSLKLLVSPQKYSLSMSSTPGIRIKAKYDGTSDKIKYSTDNGELLTWNAPNGKIENYSQSVELAIDTPIYWTPMRSNNGIINSKIITVKIEILNAGKKLAEKQLTIKSDDLIFFNVETSSDVIVDNPSVIQLNNPQTIDEAVSMAIKNQSKNYGQGEYVTEGHIILDTEENGSTVKTYTISSIGAFGFENGVFTVISGSGAIPTVITFSKSEDGEYNLLEYKEPEDGEGYSTSIKAMFPKKFWKRVLSNDEYQELSKQKEEQAKLYLESIGRKAEVKAGYVEKPLSTINTEASNNLSKNFKNEEMYNFPYWIGTKEILENNARYIYETSQSKSNDGYDLMIFRKYNSTGNIVKEYKYKIVGNEPQLIE